MKLAVGAVTPVGADGQASTGWDGGEIGLHFPRNMMKLSCLCVRLRRDRLAEE